MGGSGGSGLPLPPLLYLTWFGTLLPCLEKEEDKQARQALYAVNQAGKSIVWYPQGDDNDNNKNNSLGTKARHVGKNVVSFFRSALQQQQSSSSSSLHGSSTSSSISSTDGRNDGSNVGIPDPSSQQQQDEDRNVIPAHLLIRDSDRRDGTPEIYINPLSSTTTTMDGGGRGYGTSNHRGGGGGGGDGPPTAKIALHRVGSVNVNPNTGIIQILAKNKPSKYNNNNNNNKNRRISSTTTTNTQNNNNDDESGTGGTFTTTTAKVLATLELKTLDGKTIAHADDRALFVHYVLVLMEWDRQRRLATGHGENDDDDDDDGNFFLTQRAQKAAHFAKREIELQQVKRQRESRKAKLMANCNGGNGGLKYTALAMMQRAEDNGG